MLSRQTYNQPGVSGDQQVVFVILFFLFVVIAWKDIVSKLFSTAWTKGGGDVTTLPWGKYLGMMVFLLLAVMFAGINDEVAGVMTMIAIGILAVYLIENNGGGITTFFNWLNKTSGNTPAPVQKPTTSGGSPKV